MARTAAPARVAAVRLVASASAPRAMPPSAPPVCAVRLFAETTVARVDGPTTARVQHPLVYRVRGAVDRHLAAQ